MRKPYMTVSFSAVLLLSGILSVFWSSIYRRQLWENTADFAYQTIAGITKPLNDELRNASYKLEALCQNEELRRFVFNYERQSNAEKVHSGRTMEALLRASLSGLSDGIYQEILVQMTNGGSFSSGTRILVEAAEIPNIYDRIKEEERNTIIAYPVGINGPEERFRVTLAKLINQGGPAETMVMITIDCKKLLEQYYNTTDFTMGLFVYDSDKESILFQYNLSDAQIGETSLETLSDIPLSQKGYQMVAIDGKEYLMSAGASMFMNLYTFILIPNEQIWESFNRDRNSSFLILAAFLAVSFLITYLSSFYLTSGINRLSKAIEKIDGEHLELEIEIRTKDEVGVLYEKFLEMLDRVKEQIEIVRRHEKEKRNLEVKALQAQINPHFLVNILGMLKFMAKNQGNSSIYEAIGALGSVMMQQMGRNETVTVAQEMEYLKSYMKLIEYQKARDLQFLLEAEETVKDCRFLKMLIQPIVENSIKHGRVMEKEDGYIRVQFYEEDGELIITVKDNGVGMDEDFRKKLTEQLPESDSIGLYNVMERIRLVYGSRYGVKLYSSCGLGTLVELHLPVDRENEGKEELSKR